MKNKLSKMLSVIYIFSIIGCILLVAYLTSDVAARYFTQATGSDSASVAKFEFTANEKDEEQFVLDLSAIQYPGTVANFTFVVSNGDSEVAQKVSAKVSCTASNAGEEALPLEFTLTEYGHAKNLLESSVGNEIQIAEFSANSEDTKTFDLTVTWPKDEDDISLMTQLTDVILTLTAEQID